MSTTSIHNADTYEENCKLELQITAILSSRDSLWKKSRKLKDLQQSALTPLAKSHAAYYRKQIHRQQFTICSRLLVLPPILTYLCLILYKIFCTF